MFGFGRQNILKFDLEKMESTRICLENEVKILNDGIIKNLEIAIEELTAVDAWDSTGSAAFKAKYEATWVAGSKDRIAILERMCEHLDKAQKLYSLVQNKAEQLSLDVD